MEYLVFPFGKYKGVKINELPTTYIALALEKFELPFELGDQLYKTLLGRMGAYSFFSDGVKKYGQDVFLNKINDYKKKYE